MRLHIFPVSFKVADKTGTLTVNKQQQLLLKIISFKNLKSVALIFHILDARGALHVEPHGLVEQHLLQVRRLFIVDSAFHL